MRTHNLALIAVFLLVVGGLLSGAWIQKAWQKPGLVEERAVSGVGAGVALVQTAQGANLDTSAVAVATNAAFSSLDSISGLADATDAAGTSSISVSYSSGAVSD